MNLCVDIGNSMAKMAVFNKNQLLHQRTIHIGKLKITLKEFFSEYPKITHSVIAATGKVPDVLYGILAKDSTVLTLDRSWEFPFNNRYQSPETLGLDRIALVSAAALAYPGKNCLVIDAGTCITYDFIHAGEDYLGGAITPGLQMRYKAMHDYTANLPLLERIDAPDLIGNSTDNSMHSGVVNGLCLELDGWIGQFRSHYEDLTVILTGGDAEFLSKRLKNAIFAHSNFLLEGLNYLLEINKV